MSTHKSESPACSPLESVTVSDPDTDVMQAFTPAGTTSLLLLSFTDSEKQSDLGNVGNVKGIYRHP